MRITYISGGAKYTCKLTGILAKIRICAWLREVNSILKSANIDIKLSTSYVDDVRHILEQMQLGMRWDPEAGAITHSQELEVLDRAANMTREDLTAREVLKIMNSLTPDLRFTKHQVRR